MGKNSLIKMKKKKRDMVKKRQKKGQEQQAPRCCHNKKQRAARIAYQLPRLLRYIDCGLIADCCAFGSRFLVVRLRSSFSFLTNYNLFCCLGIASSFLPDTSRFHRAFRLHIVCRSLELFCQRGAELFVHETSATSAAPVAAQQQHHHQQKTNEQR